MRRAILTMALVLIGTVPAQATITGPPWATAAARVSRMPLPSGDVKFMAQTCPVPESVACAYSSTGLVTYSETLPRHDTYHELGHIFDGRNMDDAGRDAFMRAIYLGNGWTWSAGGDGWGASELFAEGYAVCSEHSTREIARWLDREVTTGIYDYDVTSGQQLHVCRIIRYAYARSTQK